MICGSDSSIRRWNRPAVVRWIHELGAEPLFRVVLCAFLVRGNLFGGDILRGGATGSSISGPTAAASSSATPTPVTKMVTTAQDRLARTTQALAAVRAMQTAARNLAISGPNNLRSDLPAVPVISFGQANGLVVAPGVPKDLLHPATGEDATLWTGANIPVATTQTTNGTTTSTVKIEQTQQQAILNWQSFNIGKNTTLAFDQGAGGDNAGQWIAFNYVRDPSGKPSQILGSIKTIGLPDAQGNAQVGGQVYVMNSNGIIFGGSSQVNAHALVASSLPINYNLIQRGLLNNPDAQFLFSALPQTAGGKGPTPGFDPAVASPDGLAPVQTPYAADGSGTVGNYGDVIVQPGAQLTAPTTADHVGGRIALIGPNVTNAGAISTEDGQTILAAGLQVGLAAHNTDDPTLRGLDAYVGKVTDVSLPSQPAAGTATNAGLDATNLGVTTTGLNSTTTNPTGLNVLGLIDAPRGNVFITGKTVSQSGVIDSTTSVAYNGRVDLLANYNAVPNPILGSRSSLAGVIYTLPFVFPSVDSVGPVILGPDSVSQILPEANSMDRVVGFLALPSQVDIQGQSVHFASDAILLAPGATTPDKPALGIDGTALGAGVTIRAGEWFRPNEGNYLFVYADTAQQIQFDQGASVSVAGLADVSASVAENIVSVELRGSELANSPLQRNGALRGQTIQVDVRDHGAWDPTLNNNTGGYAWVGTPLADTAGWIGLATHSVAELTTNGGSVVLKAGGGVTLQKNATIDVSGGSIDYQGGYVQTTKVLAQGHVYDIAQATPDRVYDGIYTGTATTVDPKWGTTQASANPLLPANYENGYSQGGNGGSITITAPAMTLNGTLLGSTVAGPLQRTLAPTFTGAPADNPLRSLMFQGQYLPTASSLSLTFQAQTVNPLDSTQFASYSPTPPTVFIGSGKGGDPSTLYLSPNLFDASSTAFAGFGKLRIDNSDDNFGQSGFGVGTITVPAGVNITTLPGGSITLRSANIDIEGALKAPGGSLSFTTYDISPSKILLADFDQKTPSLDPDRGQFTLGANAGLSTAGLVVDDRPTSPTAGSGPLVTGGGTLIEITSESLELKSGGLIDVAGGVDLGSNGKPAYGNGGKISLSAGQDPGIQAVIGGQLVLGKSYLSGGSFRGLSGSTGGSLSILAPLIQIGGSTLLNGDTGNATLWLNRTDATGELLLPDFFSQGGFTSFSLTGVGRADPKLPGQSLPAVLIAPKTTIAPVAQSWLAVTSGAGGGAVTLTPTTLPAGVRAPASLTFAASGLRDKYNSSNPILAQGNFVMDAGATIRTDPQTNPDRGVTITGDTVGLLGSIIAHGGTISITGAGQGVGNRSIGNQDTAVPTVDLAPGSVLDASGTTVFTPNPQGFETGTVLPGGTIKIDGNIVAEGAVLGASGTVLAPAAVLNVSGASQVLDVPVTAAGPTAGAIGSTTGSSYARTRVDSNGGSISLKGELELFSDASLLGSAGGPNAAGGKLTVSSGILASTPLPTDATLQVIQSGPTFLSQLPGQQIIGKPVLDAKGNVVSLIDPSTGSNTFGGHFAADDFTQGGFASLTIPGAVEFSGRVSISASGSLTVGGGGVILANPNTATKVTLSAPYVALGTSFALPVQTLASPFSMDVVPTYGSGALTVQAGSLIDVGSLSLQNIGTAMLNAGSGDIRGDGVLDVAGNLSLLAGQVYVPSAVTFTVAAHDYIATDGTAKAGSVTILPSGSTVASPVPLSAGGTLNVYASNIVQGGTLRAPLGTINLGAVGTETDLLSGGSFATTQKLMMQPGSVTSVSAVDPTTGQALTIPYGINLNGTDWIDPLGTDITTTGNGAAGQGLPAKTITVSAASATISGASKTQTAAQIDIAGGGDLYAYRWVTGVGGTNDILLSSSSFAVIPAYQATYAPFASNAVSSGSDLLAGDPGYVNGKLAVGDRVFLQASAGLPAGFYTLLPARYALLPGAFLVTPRSAGSIPPAEAVAQPDGSAIVAGYRTNAFSPSRPSYSSFEVALGTAPDPAAKDAPASVVRARAQYDDSYASSFFSQSALADNAIVPRLPADAGQLVLSTTGPMSLLGAVAAQPAIGGRGGLVDISSSLDILVASPSVIASLNAGGLNPANQTEVVLDSAELSSFGAESLLIGGIRQPGTNGTTVSVTTNSLTVDNAGAPLKSPEVILVSNVNLTLAPGSDIEQSGKLSGLADTLQFGSSSSAGSGQILQLDSAGASSITVAGGTTIALPAGTPGNDKITLIGSGTVTSGGTTTSFTGSSKTPFATTLSAGGTVAFANAGTIAFASGQGGSIPVSLPTLANVSTTGTTNPATLALQLTNSGTSSVADLAAGTKVAFPLGTPGNDQITLTGSGTIISGSGATTTFSGDSKTPFPTTLATGSTVAFSGSDASNPGAITFFSGTGGAIPITMAGQNSFSAVGVTNVTPAGSGSGALVRVTSDPSAQISRTSLTASSTPVLAVGSNARVLGASVTLDSTASTTLDSSAILGGPGSSVSLDSGQISLQLAGAGPLRTQANGQTTSGLVLSGSSLKTIQDSATALSLLSYSSIDIYGNGTIGSPTFARIALHAPEIHGDGGIVGFAAKDILLDNSSNVAPPDIGTSMAGAGLSGSLAFEAGTIQLGSNQLKIDSYAAVKLTATTQVTVQGSGGLAVPGDLTITTPIITAAAPVTTGSKTINTTVTAAGGLDVVAPASGPAAAGPGDLGASLALVGESVSVASTVSLPSGTLTLHATGDKAAQDLTLESSATLDVGGTEKAFNDLTKYTNGGTINLIADHGSVSMAADAKVDVSTKNGGSNAGSLSISAPIGAFDLVEGGMLLAQGGVNGLGGPDGSQGGRFSLDVNSIPGKTAGTSSLALLGETLSAGGFTQSVSLRVRTGDAAIDGPMTAHDFGLSADQGGITVTGKGAIDASGKATDGNGQVVDVAGKLANGSWKIDATGKFVDNSGNVVTLNGGTGGSINLAATGSVILASGANLTAAGIKFDDAGKGGSISLAAGSYARRTDGTYGSDATAVTDIQKGALIDLSVTTVNQSGDPNAIATAAAKGQFTGTLHLRAPQNATGTDLQIQPINGTIKNASSIVAEGYKVYSPVGGIIDTVEVAMKNDGAAFAGGIDSTDATQTGHTSAIASRLLSGNSNQVALATVLHVQPGAEIVNTADPTATTTLTLNNAASSLSLPSNTAIAFPAGGGKLKFSVGGTVAGASGSITSPDGKTTTAFRATSNPIFVAGSTVTLNGAGSVVLSAAGTLTLATGTSAVAVALPPGATYSAGGTNGATFAADTGVGIILKTPSATTGSAIAVAAGVSIALPNGTPGTDRLKASQAGRVIAPSGATTAFAANASLTIPAGAVVVLDAAGSLTFVSGSASTPISLALSKGTYTTNGAVDLTTSAGRLMLANTWNLSTYRFGPKVDPMIVGSGEPGELTLRASGSLVFNYLASLSDGFAPASSSVTDLWQAPLLSAGSQSWSYRLIAGADFSAADFRRVQSLASLGANTGSLLLGAGSPAFGDLTTPNSSTTGKRADTVNKLYETIRTGTGNIDIVAGRDVQLLDPLATIYTAGMAVATPTMMQLPGDFDLPNLVYPNTSGVVGPNQNPKATAPYPAQYSYGGGNVMITAQNDIAHLVAATGQPDSSMEMPNNWLYRRGYVDPATGQFAASHKGGEVASTSWWTDFSNFFEGVGALGGGNVTLTAGRNVSNVDAVVPTNARMPKGTPDAAKLLELGGGDLVVAAGHDVDGGVYYVERGTGDLSAGGTIHSNPTRTALWQTDLGPLKTPSGINSDPTTWLPTTLFLGKGSFDVVAGGDVLLGPVANPFLLPQGIDNSYFDKTIFSTYAPSDTVDIASLSGNVSLRSDSPSGSLATWFQNVLWYDSGYRRTASSQTQPWLRLVEDSPVLFAMVYGLMPPTLRATAFSGSVNLVGNITLTPAPVGTIDLLAAQSINGVQPYSLAQPNQIWNPDSNPHEWISSLINLSDANPSRMPGIASPGGAALTAAPNTQTDDGAVLTGITALFAESGATNGPNVVVQTQQALHGASPDYSSPRPLHADDSVPVHLYAENGNISGLTMYSGKSARIMAGNDITDIALYVQNVAAGDVSIVAAGRDLIAYDPSSSLRQVAQAPGNGLEFAQGTLQPGSPSPTAGDIQIGGPGTLEVLAGRNLDLGSGSPVAGDGTAVGITSIGNVRNPLLPFAGADIVAVAGIGPSIGLAVSKLNYADFITQFLNPATAGDNAARYLPDLGRVLGLDPTKSDNGQIWAEFTSLPEQTGAEKEAKDRLVLDVFYAVLRDAGRDHNNPASPGFKNYDAGNAAIKALFPGSRLSADQTTSPSPWSGSLLMATRETATFQGGDISVLVPGGDLTVGRPADPQKPDQGILTEHGGNISLFTAGSVNVGTSRIFTLRGGSEIIWATFGNIAAGSGSKTVHAAPPTRVLIDPQSADVKNDLAGLATGSGIGVLATLSGVQPGDVDLVAPVGTIDAGDAGIRASGNLNIAARVILNASNIQVGGSSAGTPPPPAPPNLAPLTAASNASAVASSAASDVAKQETASTQTQLAEVPSIIIVEVLGYGGEDDSDSDSDGRRDKEQPPAP